MAPDWSYASSLPRLVELGSGLVGAAFDVMKTLPAQVIIDHALASKEVTGATTVVETTSGTFGLGLAIVCATRGIKLHLVSDPAIEGFLRQRIEALGATVTVVHTPSVNGGFQGARLRQVEEIRRRLIDVFVPSQYSNSYNPRSYARFAKHLVERLGLPSAIVGPVGSGGSLSGTIASLRVLDPRIQSVAVDTHNSVLFGQPDGPRGLRGLGNSLMPPNLDHTLVDEVHWISEQLAYRATRELHLKHALYMGPTSGAAFAVARDIRSRMPSERPVVVILPDAGHRYEDTVHNPSWIQANFGALPNLPAVPASISTPLDTSGEWDVMKWRRRALSEVPIAESRGPNEENTDNRGTRLGQRARPN